MLGGDGYIKKKKILRNCERDYAAVKKFFGVLTPKRLPFVVQVTAGSDGASHSTCMGIDLLVGANSGRTVAVIRSLMVMEADEVFMANVGRGWRCGTIFFFKQKTAYEMIW